MSGSPDSPAVRISPDYLPTHYNIRLSIDIPARRFIGHADITVVAQSATSRMQLHADPTLCVVSVSQDVSPLLFEHSSCVLTIECPHPESAPIAIDYTGSLDHKFIGLFYVNDKSCVTQFEPAEARKAFPCFDEPHCKSTFSMSFETLADLTVLSNMPAISETRLPSGHKLTAFAETPPMCSYLVAFAVGRYDRVTGQTARGLPVDVYASVGTERFLHYPLREAIRAVEWLESFYGIEFGLPRLQILGSPRFMFGGMENWGLIIIVEALLTSNEGNAEAADTVAEGLAPSDGLFLAMAGNADFMEHMALFMRGRSLSQLTSMMDEATVQLMLSILSLPVRKSMATQVVAHEIVHMWAGDLVSPNWWDSLWLNEGFATLLPTIMFDGYHKEFAFLRLYDASTNQLSVILDSVPNTRPIHGQVITEHDPFDLMSYNKAGIVLGMLRRIVGEGSFIAAVRDFTREYAYKSADGADFVQSFCQSVGRDFHPFFDAWVYKAGLPLVVVEEQTLRQMPFADSEERIWLIPLKIYYGSGGERKVAEILMDNEQFELEFEYDWIIVNPGLESFCRVWLIGQAFFAAGDAVKTGILSDVELSHFLADQSILARRGFLGTDEITYLQRELRVQAQPQTSRWF
jgi:aminopeptidase N